MLVRASHLFVCVFHNHADDFNHLLCMHRLIRSCVTDILAVWVSSQFAIKRPDSSKLCFNKYRKEEECAPPHTHAPSPCETLLPLPGVRVLLGPGVHGWMF